jgi:hypothetical protein
MTYVEAQTALLAIGHDLSLTGLQGRSVSGLLQEILIAGGSAITDKGAGSDWDNALVTALGIDTPLT